MEGMLSGRARWELTPEGDGTRLTTTFDYAAGELRRLRLRGAAYGFERAVVTSSANA
jgi:hypothetical protein